MTDCWLIEPSEAVPYERAAAAMADLVEARSSDAIPDSLTLLEHPPVFTAGRRSDPAHAVWSQERMRAAGADLVSVDRGGSFTFHGPGQLIGYPVLDLGSRWEIIPHLRRMEEVIIRTGAELGIQLTRSDRQTGVWAGDAKVCAIGVRVTHRTIASHGFGLNCDTDLSWFDAIVPCGLSDARVTTLSDLAASPVTVADVRPLIARHFADVFDRHLTTPPPSAVTALDDLQLPVGAS